MFFRVLYMVYIYSTLNYQDKVERLEQNEVEIE